MRVLPLALAALLAAAASSPLGSSPWRSFVGQNAVPGCPSTCTNSTPPFVCLGLFPGSGGSAACLAACQASDGCSQATVADDDGRCFTRSDGKWVLVAGGTVAWCNNDTVPGCAPVPPANGTTVTATLSPAAAPSTAWC